MDERIEQILDGIELRRHKQTYTRFREAFRAVLCDRLMTDDPRPLRAIAEQFNVSPSWVRQREAVVLRLLRRPDFGLTRDGSRLAQVVFDGAPIRAKGGKR